MTVIGIQARSVRLKFTCTIIFAITIIVITTASKVEITAGPNDMRIAARSLVKCAIKSPVLFSL